MTGKDLICSRFNALHHILLASSTEPAQNSATSSSTKGWERELFVQKFLSQLFPRSCRFHSGDIVDRSGNTSGQIDILVESPLLYSLPLLGQGPRLNVAENVAAAVEVKSDLVRQWTQVAKKSSRISKLSRTSRKQWLTDVRNKVRAQIEQAEHTSKNMPADYDRTSIAARIARLSSELTAYEQEICMLPDPPCEIPFYVVGYKGWTASNACMERLKEINAKGVLTLKPLLLAIRINRTRWSVAGPEALWHFIDSLSEDIAALSNPARPSAMYALKGFEIDSHGGTGQL